MLPGAFAVGDLVDGLAQRHREIAAPVPGRSSPSTSSVGIPDSESPARRAAACARFPVTGYSSIAARLSSPGKRNDITTRRSAPASASGASAPARVPGRLATSLRHNVIFLTLTAIGSSSLIAAGTGPTDLHPHP